MPLSKDALASSRTAILGPVLIGNVLNWVLCFVLVAQLNIYYRRFPRDHSIIRSLVGAAFVLDVAHTCLSTYHQLWLGSLLGTEVINPWDVVSSSVMMAFACWLVQIIATVVEIFYAWRIHTLAMNKFVSSCAVIITLLALSRALSAITHAFEILGLGGHYDDSFSMLIKQTLHPEFPVWSSGGLLPDTLVVICMVYIMSHSEPHSSFHHKSASHTVTMAQIGAFPVICACLDLMLVIYFPSTNYHFVPAYILGKIYTNSLVLILNSCPVRSNDLFLDTLQKR